MSTLRCAITPNPIELIFIWMKSDQIANPEIQSLFVWAATIVRNLLVLLYQGYQMGFLIARCDHTVKHNDGIASAGKFIPMDVQKKVTTLVAFFIVIEVL